MIQILAEFPDGVGCGEEELPMDFDGDKHTNWKHQEISWCAAMVYL